MLPIAVALSLVPLLQPTEFAAGSRHDGLPYEGVMWPYKADDAMDRRAQPGFPAGVLLRCPEADDAHGLLLVDSIAKSWYVAEHRVRQ